MSWFDGLSQNIGIVAADCWCVLTNPARFVLSVGYTNLLSYVLSFSDRGIVAGKDNQNRLQTTVAVHTTTQTVAVFLNSPASF